MKEKKASTKERKKVCCAAADETPQEFITKDWNDCFFLYFTGFSFTFSYAQNLRNSLCSDSCYLGACDRACQGVSLRTINGSGDREQLSLHC